MYRLNPYCKSRNIGMQETLANLALYKETGLYKEIPLVSLKFGRYAKIYCSQINLIYSILLDWYAIRGNNVPFLL